MAMRSLFVRVFLWFWLTSLLVAAAVGAMVAWRAWGTAAQYFSPLTGDDAEVPPGVKLFEQDRMHPLLCGGVATFEYAGREAFEALARRYESRTQMQTYWLDGSGREMRGRSVPADVRELIARCRASGQLEAAVGQRAPRFALPITGSRGDQYVLAWTRNNPGGMPGRPRPPSRRRGPPPPRSGGPDAAERRADAGSPDGTEPAPGPPRPGGDHDGDPSGGRVPPPWLPPSFMILAYAVRPLEILIALVVSGLVCYVVAFGLSRPLRRLRVATQRMAAGDLSVRVGKFFRRGRGEIADLGRAFDHMAERIEALVTAQKQLLADISHEIRSPLARLCVAVGIAQRDTATAQTAALDRIEVEADRINALVGQLIMLRRLEDAGAVEAAEPVDLTVLVGEIAADCDFEARESGRRVELVSVGDCRTTGNRDLLRRAIENVVRNAVRHTADGSAVEVSLEAGPDACFLRVRDHGPGVPEANLSEIFRPFFRVGSARDRTSGGTGLGLAITRRAVEAHGGEVVARNVPTGGLEVEIALMRE